MPSWFYILRLSSDSLYLGSTTDLDKRFNEHCTGKGGRTTTLDPPVALVYHEEYPTFGDAREREMQIKRWSRAKKEALVTGDKTSLQRLAVSHDHKI